MVCNVSALGVLTSATTYRYKLSPVPPPGGRAAKYTTSFAFSCAYAVQPAVWVPGSVGVPGIFTYISRLVHMLPPTIELGPVRCTCEPVDPPTLLPSAFEGSK